MQHIQGISRHQLQMNSLEDKITADAVEENHQRYKENTQLYRKRQEL